MNTIIEFTYSSILKKHTIRTKGIDLIGRGIKQHQSEKETCLYNVYSLTKAAFSKVSGNYSEMTTY